MVIGMFHAPPPPEVYCTVKVQMGTTDRTGSLRDTGQTVQTERELKEALDHQHSQKILFWSLLSCLLWIYNPE